MTIFNALRAALEGEIANVSGIPSSANRAWENVKFNPTPGTTWVRMTLLPGEQRPATAGLTPQVLYSGLFQVDVFAPEGDGAADADALADAIRSSYSPGDSFTSGSTVARINWSERAQGQADHPWYRVSVTISWYTYA
jgi:hypothetical protein